MSKKQAAKSKKTGQKPAAKKKPVVLRYLAYESGELRRYATPSWFNACFRFLLSLLALLPVLAFFGYVWAWVKYGGMMSQDDVGNAFVFQGAVAYFYIFLAISLPTAVMVLGYLLLYPRSLTHLKAVAKQEPWHALLLFLLCWSVLGTLHSENPYTAFMGTPLQYDGLLSQFLYASFYLAAFFMTGTRERLWVLRLFTGVANFTVLLMIGQNWRLPPVYDILFRTRSSVFYNPNHYAYYLCTSLAVVAGLYLYDRGRRRTWWYAASFAFQLYGLLANDTFGCYLALFASLLVQLAFYWRSGRRFQARLAFPLAMFVLLSVLNVWNLLPNGTGRKFADNFTDLGSDIQIAAEGGEFEGMSGGNERMRQWKEAIGLIPEHPILGFGPNSMPDYFDEAYTRPHNTFLQIAVFHGIPGLLAYCGALLLLLIHQWNKLRELDETVIIAAGGTVCYLASSFFGVPLFHTTPYLFLLLSFSAAREPDHPLLHDGEAGRQSRPRKAAANRPDTAKAAVTEPAETVRAEDAPSDGTKQPLIQWKRLGVMAVIAVAVAGAVIYLFALRLERQLEFQDLTYMRLANYRGQVAALSDGLTEVTQFWLEPEEGVLVSDPVPAFGAGTAMKGRSAFDETELDGVNYDTGQTYEGKALLVTVDPAAGRDGVTLEWVVPGT